MFYFASLVSGNVWPISCAQYAFCFCIQSEKKNFYPHIINEMDTISQFPWPDVIKVSFIEVN